MNNDFTIQQLIARIVYLEGNIIPNLIAYRSYLLLYNQEFTFLYNYIDKIIKEEEKSLNTLKALKEEMIK